MEEPLPLLPRDRLLTLARRLGWMLVALFLFYFAIYLFGVTPRLPPEPLSLAKVRLMPTPPYPPERFLAEVQAIGNLAADLPAAERPEFPTLRQALARHPWVAAVGGISFPTGDSCEVQVEYRVPVLLLEQESHRFFLTRDAFVLPYEPEVELPRIRVVGLRLPPGIQAGSRLDSPELSLVSATVDALRPYWETWRVSHLELVRDPIDPVLALHLATGSIVRWASLQPDPREQSNAAKLQHMNNHWRDYGSFEKPAGPYLWELRYKDVTRTALRR